MIFEANWITDFQITDLQIYRSSDLKNRGIETLIVEIEESNRGTECPIQNGDTLNDAPASVALTTPSKATHSPSAPIATSARCRTAPVPSADTTRAAKSWTSKKPASLNSPCQA